MAFNPFVTFQKNRRFWMAAILMICMVSFVFCTGLKGDMAERFYWLIGYKGATAFTLDGRSYTTQQVHQLRDQRNLANKLMMNCSDMAFKKLSKLIYDIEKGDAGAKADEQKARREQLIRLVQFRTQIGYRKSRPRFFDIGVKFDDLVEFATWQSLADKMGVHLEESHVTALFYGEIFGVLDNVEIERAEQMTRHEFRDVSHSYIRRAIKEEFRVRIAQEAYLLSRPVAYYAGGPKEGGLAPRILRPDIPDQTRAPLTPAQIWDLYKKQRSEFNVDLLPIDVKDFVKNIKDDPTEDQRAKYYKSAKDRPADPASDVPGLQLPSRVKLKYIYADATSPAYLDTARLVAQLNLMNPVAIDAPFSPLTALTRYEALDKTHRDKIEAQYSEIRIVTPRFDYRTAPFGAGDFTTPLMMWFARHEWQAAVSLLAPTPPTCLDSLGSVLTYMHIGHQKHKEEIDLVLKLEAKRRSPYLASYIGSAIADPLMVLGVNFVLNHEQRGDILIDRYQEFPYQVARRELEERAYRRAAEEKAQENMQAARTALEKADGDGEKIKRELNQILSELKLTVGPDGDKVNKWYDRYNIDELDTLKTAYLRYIDAINMFEARDLTPEKLLKPGDFYKIFFDSSESFSAAAMFRPMPWPPVVTRPNNQRIFGGVENPKLIDQSKIENVLREQFNNFVGQNNPLAPLPAFDGLFKNAEKPILFWRTAKRDPKPLPTEYAKIAEELKRIDEAWKTAEQNIQKQQQLIDEIEPLKALIKKGKADPQASEAAKKKFTPLNDKLKRLENESGGTIAYLKLKQEDLKEDEADLKRVQEDVVKGWKFEQARTKDALPAAENVASALVDGKGELINYVEKLNTKLFSIGHLSRMYPETIGANRDYGKPPLPKDKVTFPRDDMIEQALNLYDLKEPVKVGNKELDEINVKLFERVKKQQNPRGNYVQILTNKPRSTFYVAKVGLAPQANQEDFFKAMKFGSLPPNENEAQFRARLFGFEMDQFIERVQQQDAKTYRASVIDSLQRTMGLVLEEKARKDFDEKVSD